jgi:hypothetical protein
MTVDEFVKTNSAFLAVDENRYKKLEESYKTILSKK